MSVLVFEKTNYINHVYLYGWIALLMAFIPAHGALSLDAIGRRVSPAHKHWMPWWGPRLDATTNGIVYIFAAIAKLDADWLAGLPMSHWLPKPLAGHIHVLGLDLFIPQLFAWGGLLFDALVVPLLLFRRTRWVVWPGPWLFT